MCFRWVTAVIQGHCKAFSEKNLDRARRKVTFSSINSLNTHTCITVVQSLSLAFGGSGVQS
jgi:hypothetical protein